MVDVHISDMYARSDTTNEPDSFNNDNAIDLYYRWNV